MKKRVAVGFAWAVLVIAAVGCGHETWARYAERRASTAVDAGRGARQTTEDYTLIPRGVR
jgi:hypothetical protein